MKTAISLPDSMGAAADALAERLGMTRSALYQRAIAEFLAKHDDQAVTAQLNSVYGTRAREAKLNAALAKTLSQIDW